MNDKKTVIAVTHTGIDLVVTDLKSAEWNRAQMVSIDRYWSEAPAPEGRHAEARVLWSTKALHIRFVCRQTEPLLAHEYRCERGK